MSSNLKIQKNCKHCGKEFIAKTTKTKFCSQRCAQKVYYEKIKYQQQEKENKQNSIEFINKKEILTVKEVAILLECSTKSIYRLINNKTLKAVNLADRMTRITRAEINDKLLPQKEYELKDIDLSQYYTLPELRTRFNISDNTIYSLIKRENIKKIKIGKHVYIPKKMIDNIL